MIKKLFKYFILFFCGSLFSQDTTLLTNTLSLDQLYGIVLQYHPVAKQAEILIKKGKQQLRASRGAFDPKFYSSFSEKEFKGKDYYNLAETGLKIPTWYGITLKTAFEDNRGDVFLNDQNTVPNKGLGVFGGEITLGKGLLMDARRASLRKGQLFKQSSEMEKELMLNQLFFDATKDFWKWVMTYENLYAYKEALALSSIRFNAVKQGYEAGDLPAIDTLEALIQLNDINIDYQNAQIELINARNQLSLYLWNDNSLLVELPDSIFPFAPDSLLDMKSETDLIEKNLDQLIQQHPKLKILNYKIDQLTIDKRLKAEKLKPQIDLRYNFVTKGYTTSFSRNDFKWGFTVGIPLLFREGRGDFSLAKLKLRESDLTRTYYQQKVKNAVLSITNQARNLNQQDSRYKDLVYGYEQLLLTEVIKFDIGESSMFKVNARQLKLLAAKVKANKVKTKLHTTRAKLYKELGILYLKESKGLNLN